MLTREENDLLTRVGPGTPMGQLFRQFWIPALLSTELPERDGAPVRLRLLGEDLIAFRCTDGKVALMDEYCPHRRASLFYGRNEECGIRCIYHGWKVDPEGNLVDTPNEPQESKFKHSIQQIAYVTCELGGVVWAYMGSKDKVPALPEFEWTALPDTQMFVVKVLEECNYLQGIEGGIDSSHSSFVHRSFAPDESYGANQRLVSNDTAPKLEAEMTPYGIRVLSTRKVDDDRKYIKVTPFVTPCYTFPPAGTDKGKGERSFHAWVPIDDETTWLFTAYYNLEKPVEKEKRIQSHGLQLDENFRKLRNRSNHYMQSRERMRKTNFSGIEGVLTQDHAVQESMGPICDRTREHLGTADIGIIHVRKMLMKSALEYQEGKEPHGLDMEFSRIRSEAKVVPKELSWDQVPVYTPVTVMNGE